MLCDTRKIITGYGIVPGVAGFIDDKSWGQEGGYRIPLSKGNIFVHKRALCKDITLIRDKNRYWKWQLTEFKSWAFFFTKNIEGELWFEELESDNIKVTWKYTFYSKNLLTQPISWLFTKIFWRGVQKVAINNMAKLALQKEPYLYQ